MIHQKAFFKEEGFPPVFYAHVLVEFSDQNSKVGFFPFLLRFMENRRDGDVKEEHPSHPHLPGIMLCFPQPQA